MPPWAAVKESGRALDGWVATAADHLVSEQLGKALPRQNRGRLERSYAPWKRKSYISLDPSISFACHLHCPSTYQVTPRFLVFLIEE